MAELKNNDQKVIEIDDVHLFEIDKAIFNWFQTKRSMKIRDRTVPVLFGAWERFAQMQGARDDDNLNALRDKDGMLKLPLISIRRENVTPLEDRYLKTNEDGAPSITFMQKIAHARFDNVRVPFTEKWKVENRYKTMQPVYEVHRLPFPQFIQVEYMITFWSSYIKQANQFHNLIWGDYRPTDINYNGYFFHTWFEGSSDESNQEDFSSEERIIKQTFNLQVQGYIIDKKQVRIDRTPSRILLEEKIIDITDLDPESDLIDMLNL